MDRRDASDPYMDARASLTAYLSVDVPDADTFHLELLALIEYAEKHGILLQMQHLLEYRKRVTAFSCI